MILNKKQNENQQQNGTNEKIARHRPSGASAMNTKDPMAKQKMSSIYEPGPLKRAQGILYNLLKIFHHSYIFRFN
jgi:hypothetical protein